MVTVLPDKIWHCGRRIDLMQVLRMDRVLDVNQPQNEIMRRPLEYRFRWSNLRNGLTLENLRRHDRREAWAKAIEMNLKLVTVNDMLTTVNLIMTWTFLVI